MTGQHTRILTPEFLYPNNFHGKGCGYSHQSTSSITGTTVLTERHSLHLAFAEAKSISDTLEQENIWWRFVSIALRRPLRRIEHHLKHVDNRWITLIIPIFEMESSNERLDPLFTRHDIASRYSRVVRSWFTQYEMIEPVLALRLALLYHEHSHAELRFIMCMQALEVLHRRTRPAIEREARAAAVGEPAKRHRRRRSQRRVADLPVACVGKRAGNGQAAAASARRIDVERSGVGYVGGDFLRLAGIGDRQGGPGGAERNRIDRDPGIRTSDRNGSAIDDSIIRARRYAGWSPISSGRPIRIGAVPGLRCHGTSPLPSRGDRERDAPVFLFHRIWTRQNRMGRHCGLLRNKPAVSATLANPRARHAAPPLRSPAKLTS
jgi:hypothetical protein